MRRIIQEADERTKREARARHAHARDCRKALDRCVICVANMDWFAALPPQVLSDVLAEEQER